MATATIPADRTPGIRPETTGELHSVARRPILDLRGRVHAFKLLFRGESDPGGEVELANQALAETADVFGLEKPSELKKLTGTLLAFVHCRPQALLEELAQVLPPTLTVLEFTPASELPPDSIPACLKLKALGFRLALDDFIWQEELEPLLELADYIEVDFPGPIRRCAAS